MKAIMLVENQSVGECKAAHGLSLYIETPDHRLLFDLGPDRTFLENAGKLGIDLEKVDTVIISHGHYDHGGGLEEFLKLNSKARVYIQKNAFEPHYSTAQGKARNIGLKPELASHPQVVLLEGDFQIDQELELLPSQVRKNAIPRPMTSYWMRRGETPLPMNRISSSTGRILYLLWAADIRE